MLENPEPQTNLVAGSIAYVAIIRAGASAALEKAIQTIPAIQGIQTLQFHVARIGEDEVLLATYDGARSAWPKAEKTHEFKALLPLLTTHPRLGNDSPTPWLECETICQLILNTPEPAPADTHCWHAAVAGVKPEKEAEYRFLHNHVWPGVNDAIGSARISRFDIFLVEFDDKPFIFYIFKYVGSDLDADMKTMAKNPVNIRWEKFCNVCQAPLPAAAEKNEVWLPIPQIGTIRA